MQRDIYAMIGLAFGDDAVPFGMSGSPIENTAENLVNPFHLLEQNAERDTWLRERLNGIRAFLAAYQPAEFYAVRKHVKRRPYTSYFMDLRPDNLSFG